jgi:hypothetical protein
MGAIGFMAQLNLSFLPRERPALSRFTCPAPHVLMTGLLADPNASSVSYQIWRVPRVEKRSGPLLDRLGRVRLKSTELQIELNGYGSQTDFVTET